MLLNIRDRRTKPNRWLRVKAIVEATCYDNHNPETDQATPIPIEQGVIFDDRSGLSLNEAIRWAEEYDAAVTLFIYDDETFAANVDCE